MVGVDCARRADAVVLLLQATSGVEEDLTRLLSDDSYQVRWDHMASPGTCW